MGKDIFDVEIICLIIHLFVIEFRTWSNTYLDLFAQRYEFVNTLLSKSYASSSKRGNLTVRVSYIIVESLCDCQKSSRLSCVLLYLHLRLEYSYLCLKSSKISYYSGHINMFPIPSLFLPSLSLCLFSLRLYWLLVVFGSSIGHRASVVDSGIISISYFHYIW